MIKRKNKHYPTEFKQQAVALVVEQNYSISQAASSLGITNKILYNWVHKHNNKHSVILYLLMNVQDWSSFEKRISGYRWNVKY